MSAKAITDVLDQVKQIHTQLTQVSSKYDDLVSKVDVLASKVDELLKINKGVANAFHHTAASVGSTPVGTPIIPEKNTPAKSDIKPVHTNILKFFHECMKNKSILTLPTAKTFLSTKENIYYASSTSDKVKKEIQVELYKHLKEKDSKLKELRDLMKKENAIAAAVSTPIVAETIEDESSEESESD